MKFYLSLLLVISVTACSSNQKSSDSFRLPANENKITISVNENLKLLRGTDAELSRKEFVELMKQLPGGPRITYRTEYYQGKVRTVDTVVDQSSPHCEIIYVRPIPLSSVNGPYVKFAREIKIESGEYNAEFIQEPFSVEIKFTDAKGTPLRVRCASGFRPEYEAVPSREVLNSAFGRVLELK